MKKLIALLSTITITTAMSSTIVSCQFIDKLAGVDNIQIEDKNTEEDRNNDKTEEENELTPGTDLENETIIYLLIPQVQEYVSGISFMGGLKEVNQKLATFVPNIKGVDALVAEMNLQSTKDVKVTIIPSKGYGVFGSKNYFIISDAIDDSKILYTENIHQTTYYIRGKENLEEVNKELQRLAPSGTKLHGVMSGTSTTDVLVTITIEAGYILEGPNTYILKFAINNVITDKTTTLQHFYSLFREVRGAYVWFTDHEDALNKYTNYFKNNKNSDLIAWMDESPKNHNQLQIVKFEVIKSVNWIVAHYRWVNAESNPLVWSEDIRNYSDTIIIMNM